MSLKNLDFEFPLSKKDVDEIIEGKITINTLTKFSINLQDIISNSAFIRTESFLNWTEKNLVEIYYSIKNSDRMSIRLYDSVYQFLNLFFILIYELDFPIFLLNTINNSFDKSMKKIFLFEIPRNSHRLKNFLDSLSKDIDIFRNPKPQISTFLSLLIETIIYDSFFIKVRNKIQNHSFNLNQFSLIIGIFLGIQSFLNEKLIYSILNFLIDEILFFLTDKNCDIIDFSYFLFSYSTFFPNKITNILKSFSELLLYLENFQFQITILNYSFEILKLNDINFNLDFLKNSLINIIQKSYNHEILNLIFDNFYLLSENTIISSNDLNSIMFSSTNLFEKRLECIEKLIPFVEDDLEDFTKKVLNNKIDNSGILLLLIDKNNNEEISNLLFNLFLNTKNISKQLDFSSNQKVEKMMINLLKNSNDYEILSQISFFYFNFPKSNLIYDYLIKILNLSISNPAFIPILSKFSILLKQIKYRKIILYLFEIILPEIGNNNQTDNFNDLMSLLFDWVTSVELLPFNKIGEQILNLSNIYLSIQLPKFLKFLFSKISNKSIPINIIFKILEISISENYIHWIINTLLLKISNSIDHIERFINLIFSSPNLNKSSILMLYYSCLFEADFSPTISGFYQNITLKKENEYLEFLFNFHSFNSCRRLYFLISKHLNIPINSFVLGLNQIDDNKILIINPKNPISFLPLNPFLNLNFIFFSKNDEEYEDFLLEDFNPSFLNKLNYY